MPDVPPGLENSELRDGGKKAVAQGLGDARGSSVVTVIITIAVFVIRLRHAMRYCAATLIAGEGQRTLHAPPVLFSCSRGPGGVAYTYTTDKFLICTNLTTTKHSSNVNTTYMFNRKKNKKH